MSTSTDPAVPAEPYRQPVDAVLTELGTGWHRSVGEADLRARLEQNGRNDLAGEAPVPAWRKFLDQFAETLTNYPRTLFIA